jgi:hypothetical protein
MEPPWLSLTVIKCKKIQAAPRPRSEKAAVGAR